MPDFEALSTLEALDASLKVATHLEPKHAATVAAARALAAKIDAWDQVVEWALEEATELERRPSVPANDNTSLPTFLKYLEALGLTAPAAKAGPVAKPAEPDPVPAPTAGGSITSLAERVAKIQGR